MAFIELLKYIPEKKRDKIVKYGYIKKKDLYILLKKLNGLDKKEDIKTMILSNNVIEFKKKN